MTLCLLVYHTQLQGSFYVSPDKCLTFIWAETYSCLQTLLLLLTNIHLSQYYIFRNHSVKFILLAVIFHHLYVICNASLHFPCQTNHFGSIYFWYMQLVASCNLCNPTLQIFWTFSPHSMTCIQYRSLYSFGFQTNASLMSPQVFHKYIMPYLWAYQKDIHTDLFSCSLVLLIEISHKHAYNWHIESYVHCLPTNEPHFSYFCTDDVTNYNNERKISTKPNKGIAWWEKNGNIVF